MAREIKVPNIGDFEAVEVIDVLVKAGDTVAKEDSLITLESDKAAMDVPAAIAGKIQDVLLASGRPADEPAAVISQATLPEQRVVETTLENLSDMVAAHHIETPALLVIGEIVRLRAGLDWLGAMEGRILQADPLGQHPERSTA